MAVICGRHDALEVVQHVVRPDLREYLADAGEEDDVKNRLVDLGADRRSDMKLRIEHALEELAEVLLILLKLRGEHTLQMPRPLRISTVRS
jgi:hypothetical protein